MLLSKVGEPLTLIERETPRPGGGEILIEVEACGVCRTDLHVVDGELPQPKIPLVPGHEIVGRVAAYGDGVADVRVGQRVGVPWLGRTCGHCAYCASARENLCDDPTFTGYTRDGGYATHVVADASFTLPLDEQAEAASLAPLLCAGLIGWRSLKLAGEGQSIGLYGFGAAAHILTQVCVEQGRRVHAFTRNGDVAAQDFARSLGAASAQSSDDTPPELLDAAIIFAPVGALVPTSLKAVRKGGRVVCGGIHMSDIPTFPYRLLWEERQLQSVANLTRDDGHEFFGLASGMAIETRVMAYPLEQANEALADLREGRIQGAAVLLPQ
jgi:propanol-preferring alcohol dehydrogenase